VKTMRGFIINCSFKLRKEQFGGLVFVPITEETLQVNRAGYEKLSKLLKEGKYTCLNSEELIFWRKLEQSGIVKEVI